MLTLTELTRTYGDRTVLDRVSFEVRPGRMTGFVGANGAGKTTTMRLVVGTLAMTSGEISWGGSPIDAARRRTFGYMPEERGLYPAMSPVDQLVFFGRLHAMSASDARARATELLRALGVDEDRFDEPLEKLSLGNQQRVQIAAALVHRPTALLLDEPFSGLDPTAVDAMVALLRDEVSEEVPVLFSSHQLELVERVCDDLVILSQGKVVASGPVDDLRHAQDERFRLRLAGDHDAGWVRDLRGIDVLDVTGASALITLSGRAADDVLRELVGRAPVAEFAPVVQPLSEVYREVVA